MEDKERWNTVMLFLYVCESSELNVLCSYFIVLIISSLNGGLKGGLSIPPSMVFNCAEIGGGGEGGLGRL